MPVGSPTARRPGPFCGWDHALKVTAGGTGLVGHAGGVLLREAADPGLA